MLSKSSIMMLCFDIYTIDATVHHQLYLHLTTLSSNQLVRYYKSILYTCTNFLHYLGSSSFQHIEGKFPSFQHSSQPGRIDGLKWIESFDASQAPSRDVGPFGRQEMRAGERLVEKT